MKRRLRQEIHYCKKFGIDGHFIKQKQSVRAGLNRLDGTVKYVSFIERGTSHDYRVPWEILLAREDKRPTFAPRHEREPTQRYCAVDESIITTSAGRYMAVAWALYVDLAKIEAVAKRVLDSYLADPFSAGKKADIRKEGLHFTAAHAELQNQFISELPILPFRCYVAFKRLPEDEGYSETYLDLLKVALTHTYSTCDREKLKLTIEQNSQINRAQVEQLFRHGYAVFQKAGIKRPLVEPIIEVVSKKALCISIPDFMLGVLRESIEKSARDGGAAYTRFERLRDRYALIYDADKKIWYSRRNPFHATAMDASA
jgi:hypothetical protein